MVDVVPRSARAAAWLVDWATCCDLLPMSDATWAYNALLDAVGMYGPSCPQIDAGEFDLDEALACMAEQAVENGLVEDSAIGRDRACMRVAGVVTPRPSECADQFYALLDDEGPQAATDWFYGMCGNVNYVRHSAIAKNLVWTTPTRWGTLQISINKSKPEKDPRDIAAAVSASAGDAYPSCQLCMENEGYSGRPAAVEGGHPARHNLRIVPIELGNECWGLQYSPYAYFNEHCIAMSSEHRPMHIDRAAFSSLLDFVDLLPHYFIGSNADLPIVGGSILSHDHFQGGRHAFPMDGAFELDPFHMPGYPSVACFVLEWPLSVLRLRSASRESILDAADHVLQVWRDWTDEAVGVRAFDEDGTPHNTVTPICRRRGDAYEMDLALRCNVTSDEHPMGVFHPHEDKWHVKKENIGLIEVMGLAILPPRLEAEIEASRLTQEEIGRVFASVLEDAGVFKWDAAGRDAQARFVAAL